MGVARGVGAGPVSNGDGSFGLTYTLVIENFGDVPLVGVQLSDDLAAALPDALGELVKLAAAQPGR